MKIRAARTAPSSNDALGWQSASAKSAGHAGHAGRAELSDPYCAPYELCALRRRRCIGRWR